MTEIQAVGTFAGLLLGAVAVGEGLRVIGWGGEATRRVVHVLVGLATAAAPVWFDRPRGIALLAVVFVVANGVALGRGWLPGVHSVSRRSWGTVTFPLALLVALALCWTPGGERVVVLQAAFLVLALADPAAALIGSRSRRGGRYRVGGGEKSVVGSLAFAVIAFVTLVGALAWEGGRPLDRTLIGGAAVVAGLATVAEALGTRGWDNLWIVLAVVVGGTWWVESPDSVRLGLLAVVGAAAFAGGAVRAGALGVSGGLAASLFAWGLVVLGGVAWAVPALAFFVLSSGWSAVGRRRKAPAEALAEKGSRRDAGQVMANGGVALGLLAASVFSASDVLHPAFVAAFAAAAADTWGTEVGTLVGGPTRRLGVGHPVPPGTSGGMSVAGTLGAVAGAASVVVPAVWLSPSLGVAAGGALIGVGVAGSVLDTLLGATVQARYRLPDGTLTERTEADGRALPRAAGVRGVGNDAVNWACTASGALSGALVGLGLG
ncbi:DUF92 domain-containing protein [Rubrivirga marina]|uniref:DUF92 domain-containing protein n=1 Tax=Rubrivirga marina TaxID=1196024 RepID=A0A271J156_9BACT|nr:DUF92 domain-containing protein [Rubrivirga marina]PAP77193.1 hypothetical protein BSZ37_12510 [Rubrivirga marina]